MNNENLLNEIGELFDPTLNETLASLESIKFSNIELKESKITLIIELDDNTPENQSILSRKIAKIAKLDYGLKGAKLIFEQSKRKKDNVVYIGIASGKGGVGKSTVTSNIACALKSLGKNVGIIDADIYGSSIPKIFDIKVKDLRQDENNKILPVRSNGIEIISSEFFTESDKPLLWRGPMLGRLLKHFFNDVKWDNPDFIIVDLPPGTGDVALDIQKLMPSLDIYLVTTPHPTASHVAVKAGFAANSLKHDILGVIENMSYYINPCNSQKDFIFGQGGGFAVSDKLKTELISQIPIGMPKSGHPTIYENNSPTGIIYMKLAKDIIDNNR